MSKETEKKIENLKSIVEEIKNDLEERNRITPIYPNKEIRDE